MYIAFHVHLRIKCLEQMSDLAAVVASMYSISRSAIDKIVSSGTHAAKSHDQKQHFGSALKPEGRRYKTDYNKCVRVDDHHRALRKGGDHQAQPAKGL
jgi:hypothetical protein